MSIKLNIDTSEVVSFTNKLEKMKKSALPVAIRNALNSTAFDVKQRTLLKNAKDEFEERSKNFFKANSRVEMAKGFKVDNMQSVVGMVEKNLVGDHNYSVKDLEQQEHGGTIKKKAFIPLPSARASNSHSKMVRPNNRLTAIRNILDANKQKVVNVLGSTTKQRFIRAAMRAGTGGYVLGNYGKSRVLWRIENIRINRFRNKVDIKKTPLYDYRENRNVRVGATHFMRESSLQSAKLMESFYVKEATKQIQKLLK